MLCFRKGMLWIDGLCHIIIGIYVHIHVSFTTHFADPLVLHCLVNTFFVSSHLLMCIFLFGNKYTENHSYG